jgi:hypothetical protein
MSTFLEDNMKGIPRQNILCQERARERAKLLFIILQVTECKAPLQSLLYSLFQFQCAMPL